MRTKLSLVPLYCFLFFAESEKEITCTNIMKIFRCSKLLKYFNKKGQIIRRFFLFLLPYTRFLFESLKLIRQFSPRFNQVSGCSKLLSNSLVSPIFNGFEFDCIIFHPKRVNVIF